MTNDVLVVVGTGGMGAAIAQRSGSGKRIMLADHNQAALDILADTMREQGHDVTTHLADVTSPDSVAELAVRSAGLGNVRALVHTAGLSPIQAPADAIIAVDLIGVALVLDAFTEAIAENGAGIVIASMAGHHPITIDPALRHDLAHAPARELINHRDLQPDRFPNPGHAYGFAKKANIIRVQGSAATWGRNRARINSISPGVISTPMGHAELESTHGTHLRQMVDDSPIGRLGTPHDIAAATDFLLGPHATFITGTDLLIDGGAIATAPR